MSAPTFDNLLGAMLMHTHSEIPAAVLQDTRANILATSAATVRFAIATDEPDTYGGYQIWFANGTAWYKLPARIYLWSAPDMGAYQDSARNGYGDTYVTDKTISNVTLGGNANTTTGGIRWTGTYFQVYYNSTWNNAVIGFTFQEASDGRLQIKPSGKTDWYDVFTGNSTSVGLNNLPITQQHNTHMGAYPAPQIVDGGAATMDNPTSNAQLINRTIHRILVRRMTDAERTALTAYDTYEGELVYATDTKKLYISDGAGTLTALN